MEISPLTLSLLLWFSFLFGICVGIVNDINRIVRVFFGVRYTKIKFDKLYVFLKIKQEEKVKPKKNIYLNILIFIQDIFLCLFASAGIILLNYYFNDGRFRLFTILAMLFSSTLYYLTVGKLVMLISEPIMLLIKTAVTFICRIVFLPIRLVCKWVYIMIKNTFYKTKKHIAKMMNIRYNKREEERLCNLSKHGFIDTLNNKDYTENEG